MWLAEWSKEEKEEEINWLGGKAIGVWDRILQLKRKGEVEFNR